MLAFNIEINIQINHGIIWSQGNIREILRLIPCFRVEVVSPIVDSSAMICDCRLRSPLLTADKEDPWEANAATPMFGCCWRFPGEL